MAEFLLDSEIESVSAVYHPKTIDMTVENGALISFTMKNGKSGTASVSFASPRGGAVGTLSNLGFEIYGSDAVGNGEAGNAASALRNIELMIKVHESARNSI